MDFIVEVLIQLFVQFVVEVIGDLLLGSAWHGVARTLTSRIGRYVVGAVVGLGFGLAWGHHLTGGAQWPKLLWVSIALGAAAFVLAVTRPRSAEPSSFGWREVLDPPWRWSEDRLLGFALLNGCIALGILIAFRPALG